MQQEALQRVVQRSSSSGCCGGSSGRASFAGLVKRSEFASVNWEMDNLKLNEEGDIKSAEDIVVEVRSWHYPYTVDACTRVNSC